VHPRLEVEPLLSLVLLNLSKFSNLGDFVTGGPHFNYEPETICEGFYETKNTSFLYGRQFPTLDIIIGYMVRFIKYLLIAR